MLHLDYLADILVLLGASVVLVFLSRRLRTSPVIGYLAAGILIGPHVFGVFTNLEDAQPLAELGIVFLMFSIGLELSIKRLKALRKEVFGLGGMQLAVTAVLVGGVALMMGVSITGSVVIGAGLALSSTAIVLPVLAERGELSSRTGRTSFSILLLQDLAIVPLLALLPLLGGATGGATDFLAIAKSIGLAAVAVAAILIAGRYLLRPLMRQVAAMNTQEVFLAIILLSVLGTAWATEQVGLSMTMGAFLAGLMLGETEFRHQVELDIKPFQQLLMGLFFITIGMAIDLGFVAENWWQVAVLVLTLLVIKFSVIFILCRLMMGLGLSVSARVGLTLCQGGEFALVLLTSAVRDDLLPDDVSRMVIAVVSVTMVLTPLLVVAAAFIGSRLEKVTKIGLAALEEENLDLTDHIVIIGFGRFGRNVARIAENHKIPYVAFDMNPIRVQHGRDKGVPIYYGDGARAELLWGVGIDRARALVTTMDEDPPVVTNLVDTIHRRLPDLAILARAADEQHATALREAGATSAVPDALASSMHLAQSILRQFDLPDKDLTQMVEEFTKG